MLSFSNAAFSELQSHFEGVDLVQGWHEWLPLESGLNKVNIGQGSAA